MVIQILVSENKISDIYLKILKEALLYIKID